MLGKRDRPLFIIFFGGWGIWRMVRRVRGLEFDQGSDKINKDKSLQSEHISISFKEVYYLSY